MSFSISAQFRDLCLCLKLSGSFCWGLKSTVKETGETSRAISWQVERLLRWLVMLRSTLSGSIQEVKIRGDQASTTSPPLTSLKWNPLHLITTDLPHRVTLPRWLTHGSTQTWVAWPQHYIVGTHQMAACFHSMDLELMIQFSKWILHNFNGRKLMHEKA